MTLEGTVRLTWTVPLNVVDALFIRRAMTTSLGSTVARFGAELAVQGARA